MNNADANIQLIHDLLSHLDFCGWGDRYEREVSEDLQAHAAAWQKANPQVVVFPEPAPALGESELSLPACIVLGDS